ncbi:monocarboxylate transporter 6 [Boleophthalmus pectinirostris]|uniref:monocarboxylate transporter 6 n=1 Tax=Boleophthalmus pectinirostris TaxID=150288 RepID=UPI00242A7280|nr:monocarboxylate transporter 6 [Boleophthalmus pectinirostris]XP_020773890.2 monocarboxylate transporter 6 [Boleophthalmus pectinirostris]
MTQRNGVGGVRERYLQTEACASGLDTDKHQEANNHGEVEPGSEHQQPHATAAVTGDGAPDGGWGWVVLTATILVLALTLAFPSCVGIFYTDLQMEFHATNSETSWVPSIMTSVLHAGGPFCSVLVERLGCRATIMLGGVLSGVGMAASSFTQSIIELYITAGVITGLGFCFSFQPAVTILGHYFVRRRAFANAMSSTGTALGLCVLPFLGNYLHIEYGWRGSFLILGAVLLNCCACGAVMRPLKPQRPRGPPLINHQPSLSQEGNDKKTKGFLKTVSNYVLSAIKKHMAFDQFCNNPKYCVYSIGITWMMLGFVVPLIYLVPYATAHDMEPSQAAMLLSILGVVNIVIRPPIGLIFSMPWFKGRHIYVFASALLVNGLSNSICCIGATFPVLVSYVIIYGLSMSLVGSLMFTVLMDIVEMSRFPSALGLLAIMESVTLLIGPPLAGILVDRSGQYSPVFYACSAVVASSAVFLMASFYYLDKREKKQPSLPDPATYTDEMVVCPYRDEPKEEDQIKASANGADHVTDV